MAIKKSKGESLFNGFNIVIMCILMVIMLYPFLYVAFSSVSDPSLLIKQTGILWHPLGFSLGSYKLVFDNPSIVTGYMNSILLVLIGTTINVFLTILTGYALSRKYVLFSKPITLLIVFTMFFGGGLVPNYFVVKWLHINNTLWSLILPGAISSFNMIIARTFFGTIPDSLEESAKIDGANDFTILFKIMLPLSMPIVAVLILYYGVGHWNAWFGAMLYLSDRAKYPLQLILREILITSSTDNMLTNVGDIDKALMAENVKYATIIVATVPILLVYPFLQKYFVKGVMIGAIKG